MTEHQQLGFVDAFDLVVFWKIKCFWWHCSYRFETCIHRCCKKLLASFPPFWAFWGTFMYGENLGNVSFLDEKNVTRAIVDNNFMHNSLLFLWLTSCESWGHRYHTWNTNKGYAHALERPPFPQISQPHSPNLFIFFF